MNQHEEDVLHAYAGTDGRREWVSVGTWVRPGERIVQLSADEHVAQVPSDAQIERGAIFHTQGCGSMWDYLTPAQQECMRDYVRRMLRAMEGDAA